MVKYIFSENEELAQKNRRITFTLPEKTLKEYLPKNYLFKNSKFNKLHSHCKKCGDPIETTFFKYLGICAICDMQ